MFIVSNFFIRSKFTLQVTFRANLYISGMPFLIPGIWNGSSPMPQPHHAHWFTPPLCSSWNQPLLNLLAQPSFHHGPLQNIFHHILVFSCKLLAGTAARPASPARTEGWVILPRACSTGESNASISRA